jgi:lysophospholipase L1-like esterase
VLYVADENGFRIDPDAPAPSGSRRIVAVGDSFTFGTGVPAADSFPAVLARRMGFALTNVAQPGYGLDQVWQSLLLEAIPRAPDLVVAGIYPEDLERSLSAYRNKMNKPTFRLDGGALVAMTASDRPGPVTRFLEERSRVFTLSRQVSVNAGYRFGVGEMWDLNAAMLDDMMRACRDARVPIVFVHVPPNTLDEFPALGKHLARAGALYVDPLPAMKAQSAPLYLERDMHLNEAGHALIASQVEALLRAHPEALQVREAARPQSR